MSVYLFSGVVMFFMVRFSKDYPRLRHRFLLKPTHAAHSVIVFDLDSSCNTNAALWDGLCSLFPDQVAAVSLVASSKEATRVVKDRDAIVRGYESALEKYKARVRACCC